MNVTTWEVRISGWLAALTVFTGAAQIVFPGQLLPIISAATPDAPDRHLFATVGMFMVLFGSTLLHALRQTGALPLVLLWAAMQKISAAAFVAWGVHSGVFLPLALLVAGFDLASGLLFADLRRRLG